MAKLIGRHRKVSEVLSLFIGMGCELRVTNAAVTLSNGEQFTVRYLVNPDRTAFVTIEDLNDGDSIFEEEIEYWERRLGVNIPRRHEIH